MLRVILTIVQVFASFAIVGLVLLQRGKGADAGAGFGAGASGTVFGARGAATALSHATAIFAGIFMVNSLLLTYVGTRAVAAPPKSILDTIATKPDTATPNGTGVVTPGAAPGAATTPGTSPAGAAAPPPAESPASTSTPPATGDATSTPAPAAAPAVTPAAQGPAATPAPAPAQPADGAAPK